MADTLKSLRAERDALREEVARLRAQQAAHVCAQPVVPDFYKQTMAAAGCAGGAQTYTVGASTVVPPLNIRYNTAACAGAAPMPPSFWYVIGGECA